MFILRISLIRNSLPVPAAGGSSKGGEFYHPLPGARKLDPDFDYILMFSIDFILLARHVCEYAARKAAFSAMFKVCINKHFPTPK